MDCIVHGVTKNQTQLSDFHFRSHLVDFPGGSEGKESACNSGDPGSIPGWGRSHGPKQGNPLHSILAWRIPWTEEPMGYSPWGLKESDSTEHTHTQNYVKDR